MSPFQADLSATAASGTPTSIIPLVVAAALVIVLAVVIPITVVARARRIVRASSSALAGLRELNARYVDGVMPLPILRAQFRHVSKSKAALERFDLRTFMATCVLEREAWFTSEIEARASRYRFFTAYTRELTDLGEREIGRSNSTKLNATRFSKVEQKLFHKLILAAPTPLASVVVTTSYTSPQGRNSYSKQLEWDFADLEYGIEEARRDRVHRSTAQYMRARERSLMTPRLRTDILRRDGSRCRTCGATAASGAALHIDHIVPVSRGGRTTPDNLQTLCQPCNLGKSNRFVG